MNKIISTAIVLASMLISTSVFACSCMMPLSPRQHIDATDVVFEGMVTNRSKAPMNAATTFMVLTPLKGEIETNVTVTHPVNGAACGYTFAEDYTGLVFASYVDGKLLTNLCRMMPVDQNPDAYREELDLPK